jgi:hypothetical protein
MSVVEQAHPDDILVVGTMVEARLFPQFKRYQVFSVSAGGTLHGRRFRRAYFTRLAMHEARWPKVRDILRGTAIACGNDFHQSIRMITQEGQT